jgi:hypothetical protein
LRNIQPTAVYVVSSPTIEILCEPCRRRGRYNVERLIAAHGDVKLTHAPRGPVSLAMGPTGEFFNRITLS